MATSEALLPPDTTPRPLRARASRRGISVEETLMKSTRGGTAIWMVMAALMIVSPVWAGAAVAQLEKPVRVENLTVALDRGRVVVSGVAAFAADVPMLVADDPVGDSLSGSTGLPVGDDLTTATISRPDPLADTVTFSVGVANPPPVLMGVPETLVYNWDFSVTHSGGAPGQEPILYELRAQRTALYPRLGAEPYFALARCAPVGTSKNCRMGIALQGRMRDGVVEWDVPLDLIGAWAGGVINNRSLDIWLTASGAVSTNAVVPDQAFFDEESYTVRVPEVRLGIAPGGTPANQVELTQYGFIDSGGEFRGTLPKPFEPGTYTVAVEACYGPGNCDLATQDIVI